MPQENINEPSDRPDREGERLLSVWVPISLHRKVKLAALEADTTMRAYVVEAVIKSLKEPPPS